MKKIFFTFLLVNIVFIGQSQSLNIYQVKAVSNENQKEIIDLTLFFNKYEILSIPIETIYENISNGDYKFTLELGTNLKFPFNLSPNKILSNDFVLRSKTSILKETKIISTYEGTLENNPYSVVRLSIREDNFSGVVVLDSVTYCFEPLNKYIKGYDDTRVIIYKVKDVNTEKKIECVEMKPTAFLNKVMSLQKTNFCAVINIAIATDNSMLMKYGGNAVLVQTEVTDLLNLAEAFFSPIPLEIYYNLVEIYIASPNEIISDLETNGITILQSFRSFGLGGGFSNSYEVATMWTDRNFHANGSFGVAGLAVTNGICNNWGYNLLQRLNISQAYQSVLFAHELAHNWAAGHTASPNSVNIMSATVGPSNTTWSAGTISTIIGKKYASLSCIYPCVTPLPIELSSFTGVTDKDGTNILNWVTASEVNNHYFSLQKSIDAINFQEFIQVQGAGSNQQEKFYTARDESPFSEVTYYRLKQVDFDGQYEYSQTIAIDRKDKEDVTIFPNPAKNLIVISLLKKSKRIVTGSIKNSIGQEVYFIELTEKTNTIDVSKLSAGVYFVSLKVNDKIIVEKLIIQ